MFPSCRTGSVCHLQVTKHGSSVHVYRDIQAPRILLSCYQRTEQTSGMSQYVRTGFHNELDPGFRFTNLDLPVLSFWHLCFGVGEMVGNEDFFPVFICNHQVLCRASVFSNWPAGGQTTPRRRQPLITNTRQLYNGQTMSVATLSEGSLFLPICNTCYILYYNTDINLTTVFGWLQKKKH